MGWRHGKAEMGFCQPPGPSIHLEVRARVKARARVEVRASVGVRARVGAKAHYGVVQYARVSMLE